MRNLEKRIHQRVETLPAGLQAHIFRVRDIAGELAQRHGVDPDRAALGALAHDVARAMPGDALIRRATELDLRSEERRVGKECRL